VGRGEQTREHIIEKAAGLFNRHGYAGASMADIMEATGLKKGGIYRHFESKEALAVEAFDFSVKVMGERFARAIEKETTAIGRLEAIAAVYREIPTDPPVPGGCPILSAAAENDYGNPLLRERVRTAIDGLRELIVGTVERGVRRGEVASSADPDEVATIMVSTLEGGVLLSQLYGESVHVQRAVDHLGLYFESLRS
jgi:TetR/AcrR family transcriptional regulator, transcriptional repressor for nem operon